MPTFQQMYESLFARNNEGIRDFWPKSRDIVKVTSIFSSLYYQRLKPNHTLECCTLLLKTYIAYYCDSDCFFFLFLISRPCSASFYILVSIATK